MKLGIEKFAQLLTSTYGLRVVFRGTQCHTEFRGDGKTASTVIVLPELSLLERKDMTPAELEESMEFLMSVRGFVNHEAGHVLFTNHKLMPRAHNPSDSKKGFLLNALEDLRIETKLSSMYLGAQQSLDHLQNWATTRVAASIEESGGKIDRYTQLIYGVLAVGNHVDATKDKVWKYLNDDLQALCLRFQKKIRRARFAGNTADIVGLRDEIWAEMKDEYEEEDRKRREERKKAREEARKRAKEEKDSSGMKMSGEGEEGDDSDEGGEEEGDSDAKKSKPKKSKSKPKKKSKAKAEESDDGKGDSPEGEESPEEGGEDTDASGSGSDDSEDEDSFGEGAEPDDGSGDEEDADDSEAGGGEDAEDEEDDASEDERRSSKPGESDGKEEGEAKTEAESAEAEEEEKPDRLFDDTEEVKEEAAPKSREKAMEDFMKSEIIPKATKYGAYGDRYLVYTTEKDIRYPVADLTNPRTLDRGKELLARIEDETRTLYGPVKRTLDARLRSRALSYRVGDLTEGELDRATLYRLPMDLGDSIFSQEVSAQSLKNTCVGLLYDSSGSMYDKIPMLKRTLMVFAEPLHMMRVPFMAIGFTGHNLPETMMPPTYEERKIYGRWRGFLKTPVLKEFHESWPAVKARLPYVVQDGYNYDGESVRLAAQELMLRPEKRKVLFVLSDGAPGESGGEAVYSKHLKQITEEIEARGLVDIVGIGIQDASVRQFYKRNFVVNNLNDLPTMVLSELARQLLT